MAERVWQFELPQCALGMFIGKQGKNIKALQEMSVSIELQGTSLTVMGQQHPVQIVIDNVKAIVRESEIQEQEARSSQLIAASRVLSRQPHYNGRKNSTHTTMHKRKFKQFAPKRSMAVNQNTATKIHKDKTLGAAFDYNSDNALDGLEDND